MLKATVTLAEQVGGEDAAEYTSSHILELRKLLEESCQGPYSPEVDEFALVLRIDGDIQQFDFEGCQRIRRSLKERYITTDLGVPFWRWKGVPAARFRAWLARTVKTGLICCIQRLERDKTPIDRNRLLTDYRVVEAKFLGHIT